MNHLKTQAASVSVSPSIDGQATAHLQAKAAMTSAAQAYLAGAPDAVERTCAALAMIKPAASNVARQEP